MKTEQVEGSKGESVETSTGAVTVPEPAGGDPSSPATAGYDATGPSSPGTPSSPGNSGETSRRDRRLNSKTRAKLMQNEAVDFVKLRKLREDSKWNRLTAEEREKLEKWLFEENLGYAKIASRVKEEFDLETTTTSVYRYYRRKLRERQAMEIGEAQLDADELNGMGADTSSLRTAAVKLVGNAALKLASEKPEDLEQLTSLTELLLEAEQNDLRRGRLKLAQQCFEYEATAASFKEFPEFRAYMGVIQNDESLSGQKKVEKIQRMLDHWIKKKRAGKVK